MSYYYNYYVGQRNKATGKFTTVEPYDANGEPMCLLWKSSSFASDLHEDFYPIYSKDMEDRLKSFSCFVSSSMTDEEYDQGYYKVKYMPYNDFQLFQPFRNGYVLTEDVISYSADAGCDFSEYARDILTTEQYAAFAHSYMASKKTRNVYDPATDEEIECNPSDYMLFNWVDYDGRQYEQWSITNIISSLDITPDKGYELVILETEGKIKTALFGVKYVYIIRKEKYGNQGTCKEVCRR